MSKSRVKRIAAQLADEPREKLIEIVERQQGQLEYALQALRDMGAEDVAERIERRAQ